MKLNFSYVSVMGGGLGKWWAELEEKLFCPVRWHTIPVTLNN